MCVNISLLNVKRKQRLCFDANFKLCEQCVDKFAPPHDDDIAVFRKRGLVNLKINILMISYFSSNVKNHKCYYVASLVGCYCKYVESDVFFRRLNAEISGVLHKALEVQFH